MKRFALAVLFVAGVALAGDDYLGASFDITTGAGSVCVANLRPKSNYAIRCTQDTYVRVTQDTTNAPAINKDPIASANKLYDIPTTALQTNVCTRQVTTAGTCYLYLHREKGE